MGKNIKSYATVPKSIFPREREGYLTAKSPNISAKIQHGLTVHKINIPLWAKLGFSNSPFSAKFQAKFAPFAHKSHELREFPTKIHPHLVHYFQISDHRQRTSRKLERINQISHGLPTAPASYVKFAESAPMASNLEVNPVNSRKIQRTTQIPHHSHNTSGKSREIRDICKQQTR